MAGSLLSSGARQGVVQSRKCEEIRSDQRIGLETREEKILKKVDEKVGEEGREEERRKRPAGSGAGQARKFWGRGRA